MATIFIGQFRIRITYGTISQTVSQFRFPGPCARPRFQTACLLARWLAGSSTRPRSTVSSASPVVVFRVTCATWTLSFSCSCYRALYRCSNDSSGPALVRWLAGSPRWLAGSLARWLAGSLARWLASLACWLQHASPQHGQLRFPCRGLGIWLAGSLARWLAMSLRPCC